MNPIMLNTIDLNGFRLFMMTPSHLAAFSINHSSMTKFAISKLVLIQQLEVNKHSQFFQQVQLWSIVKTSRTFWFKF